VSRVNPGEILSGGVWGSLILGRYFLEVSRVNPWKILSGGVRG
jgi:hypothetical protein